MRSSKTTFVVSAEGDSDGGSRSPCPVSPEAQPATIDTRITIDQQNRTARFNRNLSDLSPTANNSFKWSYLTDNDAMLIPLTGSLATLAHQNCIHGVRLYLLECPSATLSRPR